MSRKTRPLPTFISSTADIQGDYRYSLTRVWDASLPTLTFVLLNPSTADATQLDNTLRRCVDFSIDHGFGSMRILNVYAYRATKPSVMRAALDPVGPENDRTLSTASGTVVAGWGAEVSPERIAQVLPLLPQLHALKVTKDGHPGHPLYIHGDARLIEWSPRS